MDDVHAVFESILDYATFSLRIREDQLEQLPQILLAVPEMVFKKMQANLATVWHRWGAG